MIHLNGKSFDLKISDPSIREIITVLILIVGVVLLAVYTPHRVSEILRLFE
jgi:hypothetical protein